MHELGIAMRIADITSKVAKREGVRKVTGINVDIGELAGIVPDLLEFSFKMATKNTSLEKTRLNINIIPATAMCLSCEKQFAPDGFLTVCPVCGTYECNITKGKELNVQSIMSGDEPIE